ncbi:hypothetical protein R9X47_26515 [Wukongibacter baidiensis]|uniref:hypothetical protein n=1 Tax=Wukongibacter baidiensis TaxID=1723361 RepID=UPI003D7F673E
MRRGAINTRSIFLFIIILMTASLLLACNAGEKQEQSIELKLGDSEISFLNKDEGVNILAAEDDYIKGLSSYDYAAKLKTDTALNLEERREFYKDAVLAWNDSEKQKISSAIEDIDKRIADLKLNLPEEIGFIKTNGTEEGGAAYTRGVCIVLPEDYVAKTSDDRLRNLIIHELFHVYSRYNEDLHDDLYGIINYKRCEELEFPDEIKDLKISNPDAPLNNYYIECTYNGKSYNFIPVIYSSAAYEGGSFFRTLIDEMLAIEVIDGKPEPIYEDGKIVLANKEDLEDFYEKIGTNTDYTFHPEETLADNFVILVMNEEAPSKWVIDEMKKVIQGEPK